MLPYIAYENNRNKWQPLKISNPLKVNWKFCVSSGIMFEKGLVKRDDSSKTHIYQANVSKEITQQQFMGKMIHSLFSGSSTQLVMQALGNHQHSKEELEEIQQLLNNLKKQ